MADKIATREAYGKALAEFGAIYENLVVLDADLAAATKTATFKKAFPERHFDCGIAENNMICVATGMSLCGKIPFASTFAMFAAGRSFEQIRNSIGYPHNNVKIGATHAGITVGEDGATHQCCEDIALMRTIPGMTILNPADAVEARLAVKAAIEFQGPVYLRFTRDAIPVIYDENDSFEIGKAKQLRDGKDVAILANGDTVRLALEAAEALAAKRIGARVLDVHTIKPLDVEAVTACIDEIGSIITVEDHNIMNGLGSAVAEVIAEAGRGKLKRIGIQDQFGQSAPYERLLAMNGITVENIAAQAETLCR